MGDGLEPDLHLESLNDLNLDNIRYIEYGGGHGGWYVDGIPVKRRRDFEQAGKRATKNRIRFGLVP